MQIVKFFLGAGTDREKGKQQQREDLIIFRHLLIQLYASYMFKQYQPIKNFLNKQWGFRALPQIKQMPFLCRPSPLFFCTPNIFNITMFTEQLSFISVDRAGKDAPLPSSYRSRRGAITQADLEYELCGTFMRHTGQRLSARESELMQSSRQFIELYGTMRRKEVDSSQTLDTMLQDLTEGSFPDEERSLGLNRKNSSPFGSRKHLLQLSDQLAEIQERCSLGTFSFFNSLVAEYKKLQSKIKQCEAREVALLKREEQLGRLQEETLILRKRLEQQQQRVGELEGEAALLREKNRSINSCINEKINSVSGSHKYFEINHKVYRDIKTYLQEKEAVIKAQYDSIAATETSVLSAIEQAFKGEACTKCCEILKKLKDSIIRFKKYLEGESAEFERIYDKYKKTMYSVKSRPSV